MLILKLLPPPLGSSFCHLAVARDVFKRHPFTLVKVLVNNLANDGIIISSILPQGRSHVEEFRGGHLLNFPVRDWSIGDDEDRHGVLQRSHPTNCLNKISRDDELLDGLQVEIIKGLRPPSPRAGAMEGTF